ncbi:MAG: class I SAM-dependent methyltransferase [Candidatus Marsarchaeota archaeon]|nr:class I SAM-dependent methyltransferase [Candidatus Marsarchaeota archaeon]
MKELNHKELFDALVSEAESASFSGWSFDYLTKTYRMVNGQLPWSYASEVLPRMRKVSSMLDIGTGGGEMLALLAPFPKKTYATENYKPNIGIAKKRLEPLGVKVYGVERNDELPFRDSEFELVINRHASYSDKEVYRILKHGGVFVNQQIGAYYDIGINRFLGAKIKHSIRYVKNYAKLAEEAGFDVIAKKEAYPRDRFYDIGAIIYYMKAIPWQLEGFEVEKYKKRLYALHEKITEKGYMDFKGHNFLIVARKP